MLEVQLTGVKPRERCSAFLRYGTYEYLRNVVTVRTRFAVMILRYGTGTLQSLLLTSLWILICALSPICLAWSARLAPSTGHTSPTEFAAWIKEN